MITAERVRELFNYDPKTGIMTWRIRRGKMICNSEAGWLRSDGYRCINVDGRQYRTSRLVWIHTHNVWPINDIDHRDGVRDNNRIKNLRDITRSENAQNQAHPHGNSPYLGVSWHKANQKWRVRIRIKNKFTYLGCFDDIERARDAYLTAKKAHHIVGRLTT